MVRKQALVPVVFGAVAGFIFAVARPGLTDFYNGAIFGRLQWAALGAVIVGGGLFLALRVVGRESTIREKLASGVAAVAIPVLAVLAWLNPEAFDRLASTAFTVAATIGLIAVVWIGLNLLVGLARKDWAAFSAVGAAAVAAIFFAILRGNLSVTALVADPDPIIYGGGSGFIGHVEWPIFGALVWGAGMYLVRKVPNQIVRLGIGAALGVVSGWFIGTHLLLWQRPALNIGSIVLWVLIGVAVAIGLRAASERFRASGEGLNLLVPSALVGAAVGWVLAVWLRAPFVGSETDGVIAAVVPLALLGARLSWSPPPDGGRLASFEHRSHAAVFLGPAVLFLSAALVIPTLRTIFLSFLSRGSQSNTFEGETFSGFNSDTDAFIGFDNYRELRNDSDSFDVSDFSNIFTSQLFWVALALIVTGVVLSIFSGTRRNGTVSVAGTETSVATFSFGMLLLAFAAFAVLRGTFFNNLWWVVTVTTVTVVLGLAIAVLAERAGRFETIAKSLIFMPMAVSFVGASIVWRLQYQPRAETKPQTGVLNALWVKLGDLSHSGAPRIIVLVLLACAMGALVWTGANRARRGALFGAHVGGLICVGYLFVELVRRSLGGFRFLNGERLPETVVFLQEPPFNNVFLMVILIWAQTGFAMVLLAAAIKAVPPELTEAAEVDGATESQSFFQVVLPQILPTIGVVTTTLAVLVMKVFDIVKVSTGGNFGTNVLANDFFEVSFSFGNFTLGSTIAVFILISVLPVIIYNVRQMQKGRVN